MMMWVLRRDASVDLDVDFTIKTPTSDESPAWQSKKLHLFMKKHEFYDNMHVNRGFSHCAVRVPKPTYQYTVQKNSVKGLE